MGEEEVGKKSEEIDDGWWWSGWVGAGWHSGRKCRRKGNQMFLGGDKWTTKGTQMHSTRFYNEMIAIVLAFSMNT